MLKKIHFKLLGWRRVICEFLGISSYSMPAYDQIDIKLEKYLPRVGVFVEAGANNGFTKSNTYYLEKIKKWKGILVEPLPFEYQACKKIRRRSKVYNCALVPSDYPYPTIELVCGGLMSFVDSRYQTPEEKEIQLDKIKKFHSFEKLTVEARSLTSVIEQSGFDQFDFMSLDIEGLELEVLRGLNLEKFRPKFILIECRDTLQNSLIMDFLESHRYIFCEQLSHRDYLYRDIGIQKGA